MSRRTRYRYDQTKYRHHRFGPVIACLAALVVLGTIGYLFGRFEGVTSSVSRSVSPKLVSSSPSATPAPLSGQVLSIESQQTYSQSQAETVARQNYGNQTLTAEYSVTKITFRYQSRDVDGTPLVIYGRAYIPTTGSNHPIFAFAPGTTGIGDECAASLENVAKANWGNYDSHMLEYADQGYAAVTTDYEGMRDPTRIHHYMIGVLEGRALLDAVRALKQLPQASGKLSKSTLFLGGYSQGGHAAYWADTISATYTPELKITGVVGWGPVMNVQQSIGDVVYGSTLNWFGPYVLVSYADYYHQQYDLSQILQPKWIPTLTTDVLSHCIDSDITYWGRNPNAVYTPQFLAAINSDSFATDYPALASELSENAVGTEPTTSAKLINEGRNDNVVLPREQAAVYPQMCKVSRGPVALKLYDATHYDNMVVSLHDTLAWMSELTAGIKPPTTCPTT